MPKAAKEIKKITTEEEAIAFHKWVGLIYKIELQPYQRDFLVHLQHAQTLGLMTVIKLRDCRGTYYPLRKLIKQFFATRKIATRPPAKAKKY